MLRTLQGCGILEADRLPWISAHTRPHQRSVFQFLPVRIFARDMLNARFPVLRYEIRWTPEQNRTAGRNVKLLYSLLNGLGYVTHGTDRSLWAFRLPILNPDQVSVARSWLDAIDEEKAKQGENRSPTDVLVLDEDRSIHWVEDRKWEAKLKLGEILVQIPL